MSEKNTQPETKLREPYATPTTVREHAAIPEDVLRQAHDVMVEAVWLADDTTKAFYAARDAIARAIMAATEAERERCAKNMAAASELLDVLRDAEIMLSIRVSDANTVCVRARAAIADWENMMRWHDAALPSPVAAIRCELDALKKENSRLRDALEQKPEAPAIAKATAEAARNVEMLILDRGYWRTRAEADHAPQHIEREWRPMETAPDDGRHCILAIPSGGGSVYAIQGAYLDSEWHNAAGIRTRPLAWMPSVMLPDEYCPWTDAFKARQADLLEDTHD